MKNQTTGKLGERIAAWYLKAKGYTIVQTNYHTRAGEIDIIARQNNTMVFIEVKTRSTLTGGLPEEAVTPLKLEKFQATVDQYLLNQPADFSSTRIDVISINLATAARSKITHFKNISFDT